RRYVRHARQNRVPLLGPDPGGTARVGGAVLVVPGLGLVGALPVALDDALDVRGRVGGRVRPPYADSAYACPGHHSSSVSSRPPKNASMSLHTRSPPDMPVHDRRTTPASR